MRRARGVVLASVMFALVILGVLAAGATFLALQQSRLGRNAVATTRSQLLARSAADNGLVEWDPSLVGGALPGEVRGLGEASVLRLSRSLFAIEGRASELLEGVEQRFARLVRVDPPTLAAAALAVRTSSDTSAASFDAGDHTPGGWQCQASDTILSASIQFRDTDSALWSQGAWNWDRLRSWAARGGRADSLELRYAGDQVITGGRFLGVLVVDGDLVVRGAADLVGAVFVRGSVVAEGLGGTLTGTLVAGQVRVGSGASPGALKLAFSSCAARAVLLALGPPRQLPGRSGIPLR